MCKYFGLTVGFLRRRPTDFIGSSQEVDHQGGFAHVGQDGVVQDHQHLLIQAAGQLQQKHGGLTIRSKDTPLS